MVRFVTLVGAAALLAQSAFGATVPVRRTNQDSNLPENNSYNQQYNNNQYQQQNNQYQQQNNQYEQPQRNQYNNYQQQQQQQHQTSSVMAHETSTAMAHESTVRQMEQSSMMAHETSTAMAHESTVRQMEQSSVMSHETSTRAEVSMPSYGSGSSQWGNNYNDCVSQCMAQFGTPPSRMTMNMPPEASSTDTASGAVHTVMVAPDGAGLRYVPFAVNASVGDTIRYVWTTPKNHTATLSSALAICNKSGIAEQRNFVSGIRNAESGPQTFDVKLETAEPQFFYCSVGVHCASGMFGMINPATGSASSSGSSNTVGEMMTQMIQSNPSMEAAYRYLVQNMTGGSAASQWGMTMSLEGIPESSYADVASNVLFTQASFAANPGMMESNGAQTPDNSPIAIPADFNVLLSNIALSAPTSTTVGGEAAATSSTSRPAITGNLTPVNAEANGALSGRQGAGVWIAAVVGVAGWLLI